MEPFKVYGGYVAFRPSGDVAFPVRACWVCANHKSECADGMTDADAWQKLDKVLSMKFVTQTEPDTLGRGTT